MIKKVCINLIIYKMVKMTFELRVKCDHISLQG